MSSATQSKTYETIDSTKLATNARLAVNAISVFELNNYTKYKVICPARAFL